MVKPMPALKRDTLHADGRVKVMEGIPGVVGDGMAGRRDTGIREPRRMGETAGSQSLHSSDEAG